MSKHQRSISVTVSKPPKRTCICAGPPRYADGRLRERIPTYMLCLLCMGTGVRHKP